MAACHMEAHASPKHRGHIVGKTVVGPPEARPRLVVCVRSDVRGNGGLDAVTDRAMAPADVGANMTEFGTSTSLTMTPCAT
ncbi:hypothetical protein ACFOY4_41610 [Actinomadura syzygii]|uniref:Uncharacterized protein n=1 Tax=Actinomadura syzygii TaxID=1427538 RepID=A0A5D0TQP9_9ACTN|nr:hypothetical protein [Actinomadura syzygii]TYC07612.1 hypothetical protein FXF65_42210 [Actinomadura syzygii]